MTAEPSRIEIYGLFDPRDGALRYVGKAKSARRRFRGHLAETRRRTPVYDWIAALRKLDLVPELKVLATVAESDWQATEREVIARHRAEGARLLNLADGGDEPYCPPETRRTNAKRNARAIHDDPERKRIWTIKRELGQLLREGFLSNERRAQLREAARMAPHIFGLWANLPDRDEHPDGTPVHEPGKRAARSA